jgi:nitroreductase
METLTAIMSRRSIRKYSSEPVSDDLVRKILGAAMNAPSAGNQQPWQFIVVKERKSLDAIAEILPYGKMLKQAPLAIVVCGDLSHEKHKGFWVQDCSAATQNMLLAAHDLGLGAVWLGVYPREERMKGIGAFLKVPEQVMPFCVVSAGWPAEKAELVKRFEEKKVHWNEW